MPKIETWMALLRREMDGEFPWWGNANYTHGAMRATGLAHGRRRTLVVETLAFAHREGELQRTVYVFNPERERGGYVTHHTLAPESAFIEAIDDRTTRSRVTGVVHVAGRAKGGDRLLVPRAGIAASVELRVDNKTCSLPVELPETKGVAIANLKRWQRLLPEEVLLFQLVDRAKRNALYGTKGALKQQAGLPASAKSAFSVDDWRHPIAPDDEGSDLGAICRGLIAGNKPKLSKEPNGDWRLWLDPLLRTRQRRSSWWGIGAKVLEDEAPVAGATGQRSKADKASPPAWLSHRTHPRWHAHGAPGAAMRASGFTTRNGPALMLEAVVASHRLGLALLG